MSSVREEASDDEEKVYFGTDALASTVFREWKVAPGTHVVPGAVLFTYSNGDGGDLLRYKATRVGTVFRIERLSLDQPLTEQTLLLTFKDCEHPVVMKDMCAECGQDLRKTHGLPGERRSGQGAKVAMIHSVPELQITPQMAKSHGEQDEKNLLRQRKLVLLVDLDQTLIHTTNDPVPPDLPDVHDYQLYGPTSPWYHTRIRPHTSAFLTAVAEKYELHICTFGQRLYAHSIAKILDIEQKGFFGHRILSRDECFDPQLKTANLRALFPHGDHMVCIIDDRDDVWQCARNLIRVKPYRFFKHTGDINAPAAARKTDDDKASKIADETSSTANKPMSDEIVEQGAPCEPTTSAERDASADPKSADGCTSNENMSKVDYEEDDDDYLLYLEEILNRIHSTFYEQHDKFQSTVGCEAPDLKLVIPFVKRKVLHGVRLVLSGLVPLNTLPETTTVFRMARSFGAVFQAKIVTRSQSKSQYTTHLICAKTGTSKWKEAVALPEVKIVQPAWLWSCVERWERVDEALFAVQPPSITTAASAAPAAASVTFTKGSAAPPTSDLPSFSKEMMRRMSDEVDDALSDADDDAKDEADGPKDSDASSSSSGESLSGDVPKGWAKIKRKRSGADVSQSETKKRRTDPDDVDESSSDSSDGNPSDDEMIDALEKQFT